MDDQPAPLPPPARRRARAHAAVLLLCLLVFAARALTLTAQGLWLDEVDALGFAARPAGDLLAMFAQPAQNGPLYYLLLKGWTALAGTSEFGLRSFSLLAGLPALPLTYLLGRRLLGRETGLWAALFAAVSPYLFFYGQEGKMYALYLSLALLSMLLFLAGLRSGGIRRWAAWLLVTAAGVYVHLFLVFLPVAQHAVALALFTAGERPKGLRSWYLVQGAALAALAPVALWTVPALLNGYATAFAPRPLPTMVQVLLLRFSLHTEVWPSFAALLPFGLALTAAVPSVARGARKGGSPAARGALLTAVWLATPVLAAYFTSWQAPVFMHRYFMLIVPAYELLLAAGVTALRARVPAAGWLCGAGIVAASLAATVAPAEVRPDFRDAAAYVRTRLLPGDRALFVAGYGDRPFRYYLPAGELPEIEGPYTNDGTPPEAAEAVLRQQLEAANGRVWLVEFEEWLWDSRGISSAWLFAHDTAVGETTFPGVRVTEFAIEGR